MEIDSSLLFPNLEKFGLPGENRLTFLEKLIFENFNEIFQIHKSRSITFVVWERLTSVQVHLSQIKQIIVT